MAAWPVNFTSAGAGFGTGERMSGLNRALQAVARDMGIDLGRRDIGMAEQGLDASKIGAALDQMRRKSMAQDVRRKAIRIDPRFDRQALQQLMTAPPGEMRFDTS